MVDADLFFIFQRADSKAAQQNYDKLIQHPFWQQLRAPQDKQVFRVDAVAWSLSGGILGANRMLDEITRVAMADNAS